jgi:hypothetical protein
LIHHRQSCCILAAVIVVCGWSAAAQAQLPGPVVQAPVLGPGEIGQIDAFVDRELAKLTSNNLPADLPKISSARNTLYHQAEAQGATPNFLIRYAESLNKKLLDLLKKPRGKDPRVRLNAAIVTARIANKVQNSSLAGVTQVLLRDDSEAVALWGLQAAKVVVPLLLNPNPATQPDVAPNPALAVSLGQEVVQAATKHGSNPAVIEEAYRTLLLNSALGGAVGIDYLKGINSDSLRTFLPLPIAMLEARIKQYDTDVPPQPVADWWCCKLFLVNPVVWKAATPAQQEQIKQVMLALLKGAAKQKQAVIERGKEMFEVIHETGVAFQLLANNLKAAMVPPPPPGRRTPLQDTSEGVASLPVNCSPDEIDTAISRLELAVNGKPVPPK